MKKIIGLILGSSLLFGIGGQKLGKYNDSYLETTAITAKAANILTTDVSVDDSLNVQGKSAYLMDYNTQTVMYSYKETERLPIASMCKIMTLVLCFEAIDEGIIHLDEEVRISENASSMGGSQVFLEANANYKVNELIKSIVVCSANDSCVAMAEKIAGSESLFVNKMNKKASEIGAENTLFANCTGLPKQPQYSCAKDVALMLKQLLKHEQYYEYGKVWMDKFAHPKGRYTEITNTNKLVRFYDGCDGGKTGFTNEAGFCLAATAKRNDMRIISVVIGEESSAKRFEDVRKMFDYGFANYVMSPIAEANVTLEKTASVSGGKEKSVAIYPARKVCAFCKRGEKATITKELHLNKLKAPIKQGEKAGELVIFKNGVEIDRVTLLTEKAVKKANIFDSLKNIAENWNKR